MIKRLCIIIIFFTSASSQNVNNSKCFSGLTDHNDIITKFYEPRKHWRTSNLGSILFKNIEPELFVHEHRQKKNFTVLIYQIFKRLSSRHIYSYNESDSHPDILKHCSVKNCVFTGNDSLLNTADAVVVNVLFGRYPNVLKRNTSQRWIFLSDESPVNIFFFSFRNLIHLNDYAGQYNWTMNFRSDADIPVPYGRTIPLAKPKYINTTDIQQALMNLVPNWKKKRTDVLATILASNCQKNRMNILRKIKNHMRIDIYGGCGKKEFKAKCPKPKKQSCNVLDNYLFYIAIENTQCKQYITEKVFYNAFSKGAIPVVFGALVADYERLLPPNSYIHMDSYKTVEGLAKALKTIAKSPKELFKYHKWRLNFEIVNEHGYFGTKSYHYCRVCEALNYNDGEVSIYDSTRLRSIFDKTLNCNTEEYNFLK